jgi:hypothetical protein
MNKTVIAVLLLAVTFAFAAKERPGPMLTGVGSSALAPDRDPAKGAEFAHIRVRQALLLARGDAAGAKQLENEVQAILLARQETRPSAQPVEVAGPPPGWNGAFEPDKQITTGPSFSFAADYEQDPTGTMWVAVGWLDSTVRVFKSEDHGASWPYVNGFYWPPKHPIGKLEMAVGEGDSNFVYVAELLPANDGDLAWSRINQDGTGLLGGGILSGPDSITDFAFCRDYVTPYYLYAVAYNGMQEPVTSHPVSTILRSTNYARAWAITDTLRNAHHPRLRAGNNSYIYLGAAPHVADYDNVAQATLSPLYFSPNTYSSHDVTGDTFRVWDAVFAPAFTDPGREATAWIVYSHNYNGTTDWDVLYAWTRDSALETWSAISDIAYSSAIEAYVDLKNYTSDGNTYVNASYVVTGPSEAYRTFADASTPDDWATAEQINQGTPVAWNYENIPQLVYSPYGPGSGAGLVFAAATGGSIYFNAPWLAGVADRPAPRPGMAFSVSPSVARGPVRFGWSGRAERLTVTDVCGRIVGDYAPTGSALVWDGQVAAGTYFVRLVTKSGTATRTVVIQ